MARKPNKPNNTVDHNLDQLSFFGDEPPPPEHPITQTATFQKGRIYRLNADELLPDPAQPRQYFDEEALNELADSINRHGILQPIIFRQTSDGRLFVVAGGRRLAAARKAGLKNIPSVYTDGKPAEIALVENLVRQDLTCIEEAEAIEHLKSAHGYTLKELSAFLGKSVSSLSEIISLTRLPLAIREECRNDMNIARSILVEIAKLSSTEEMLLLYRRYRNQGLSRTNLRICSKTSTPQKPGYTRMFRTFSRRITAIDVSTLANNDRAKVRRELESLREVIEKHLSGFNDPATGI